MSPGSKETKSPQDSPAERGWSPSVPSARCALSPDVEAVAFFEEAPGLLLLFDQNLRLTGANRLFATELSVEFVPGTPLNELWPQLEATGELEGCYATLATGQPCRIDQALSAAAPLGTPSHGVVFRVPSGLAVMISTDLLPASNQLATHMTRIQAAVDSSPDAVAVTDTEGKVVYINQAFGELFQHTHADIATTGIQTVFYDQSQFAVAFQEAISGDWSQELLVVGRNNVRFPALVRVASALDSDFCFLGTVFSFVDLRGIKKREEELLQARKFEAVGQLAAGVAHELNTPNQYVQDHLGFLQEGFDDLMALLQKYEALTTSLGMHDSSNSLLEEIQATEDDIDLPYLVQEIPKATESCLQGLNHIAKIVGAMKELTASNSQNDAAVDLNRTIENIIVASASEWKKVATVQTNLAPDLPTVNCNSVEIYQVLLNLIINAAHAIAGRYPVSSKGTGLIAIASRALNEEIEIRISDNGSGIPEAIQDKVFDPFFTTKPVGQGTGQGLAVSRALVVNKHGGDIRFESEAGAGTTFIVRLPIR